MSLGNDLIVCIFTNMLWHFLRYLMSLTLVLFYRRVAIKNAKHFKVKGPVIIALNHPNAFMDPVGLTLIGYPPKIYYLARGDAFKPGIANYILNSLGLVPIFRIQDGGKDGLKKNDESYRRVNELLAKNKKIMIFAEGLCIMERRLRSLKKGVPRMVFGAMEQISNPDLIVVPVGVNYTNPKKFRSNLFYNVGEPIRVNDYMEQYHHNGPRTMNIFIHDLSEKMKTLIIHINNPENDKLIFCLEELYNRDWCKQQHLNYKNVEHEYLVSKQIAEVINKADDETPELVKALNEKSNLYFKEIKKLKIRDWLINPNNSKKVNGVVLLLWFFILLIGFPWYLRGLMGNYIPYKLSEKIIDRLKMSIEFHASFNLGIGTALFLIFYGIQFLIAKTLSPHIGWPLLVICVSLFTGWLSLRYHPFKQKTLGLFRVLMNKSKAEELRMKRKEISDLFNSINKI